MGNIRIVLDVSDKKARLNTNFIKPSSGDLSAAITQLELLVINMLGKVAKKSKISKINYPKEEEGV